MTTSVTLKTIVRDALAGLLALILILVVVQFDTDLRLFVIATAVVFGTAAFLQARRPPSQAWAKGVIVTAGGALPVVLMSRTHAAFTAPGAVTLFVLVSLPVTIVGASSRHLWATGSRKWALTELLLGLGAVLLITVTVIPSVAARMFTERVNWAAPSFSMSVDGRVVSSSELEGKVTVLAFWATWCAPCYAEMPQIEQVMLRYRNDPQVAFWAVDRAWGGDTDEKARAVSLKKKWVIPLAFDNDGVAPALGIANPPSFVILDKGGHVRIVHKGYDASEDIQTSISHDIESLLRGSL